MRTRFGFVVVVCVVGVFTAPPMAAERWTRVKVNNMVTRAAVESALEGALEWMAQTRCQALLTHFNDEQGCPLIERLAATRAGFDAYLRWVVVRDASGTKKCESSNQLAFTTPGSRVVFVCGTTFGKLWRSEPGRAKAVMIHEVLHTLGLGENGPNPTSREITKMVLATCEK